MLCGLKQMEMMSTPRIESRCAFTYTLDKDWQNTICSNAQNIIFCV